VRADAFLAQWRDTAAAAKACSEFKDRVRPYAIEDDLRALAASTS